MHQYQVDFRKMNYMNMQIICKNPQTASLAGKSNMIKAAIFFLLSLSALEAPAEAKSDGSFPGKGSYTAWVNANTFLKFGNDFAHKGELDRALESYKKAIQTYPYDSAYYLNLGNAFSMKGNYQIAEESYRKAIDLEESYFQAWLNLGHALARQGRSLDAAKSLKRAADLCKNPHEKAEIEKQVLQFEQLPQMESPQVPEKSRKKKKSKKAKE